MATDGTRAPAPVQPDPVFAAEFECRGCQETDIVKSTDKIDEVPNKYCSECGGGVWLRIGAWSRVIGGDR